MAGISVRTLHYYDEIGLLKPRRREDNGYHQYTYNQQILLQQILIYRALDFSTDNIKKMLSVDDSGLMQALESQKDLLLQRQQNLNSMINSIVTAQEKREAFEMLSVGLAQHFSDAMIYYAEYSM
ncbi:MAG: DNA-binding transcriptional MerR regulator [Phenylobacterium sp.]